LAPLIRQEFDLDVHPRTIERALGGKKTPRWHPPPQRSPRPMRPRWSKPSTRRCASPRLVSRCHPKRVAGSYSFYAAACGRGLGRWPLQGHASSRYARLFRHRPHRTTVAPSFTAVQDSL